MNLRSRAAWADEENFIGQFGPGDMLPRGKRMSIRHSRDKRLGPNSSGVAIGRVGSTNYECDVELIGAQLHERLPRCAFGDFKLDARIGSSISADQLGEETMRDQAVDAHAQSTAFSQGRLAGSLHSMFEVFDTSRHPLDKKRPASVSRTPRVLRSKRRIPSSTSSARMRALTLDWLTPSAWAAWRKFKCSATTKAWIKEAIGIREPSNARLQLLALMRLLIARAPCETRWVIALRI